MNNLNEKKGLIFFAFGQILIVVLAFIAGLLYQSIFGVRVGSFPLFREVYDLLEKNALFSLPTDTEIEYGMIRGMVTACNDPYTVFC